MTSHSTPLAHAVGLAHLRLTVTDIARSKAFYSLLLGQEPAIDFSDRVGDAAARQDPAQFFGGCVYALGDQLLGLRPVAEPGDTFSSTRVGLDHVSLLVESADELRQAVSRLDDAGVEHGDYTELDGYGMAIVSIQDPDDINLELAAPTG